MKEQATFAGGCFWCTEAIFSRIKGVESVISGYTGGTTENPSYYDIASGKTDHAEAIQLTYDPDVISYEQLLDVFFGTHDPTTLNRQGADIGKQYRSAIFYHNEEQQTATENKINELEEKGVYKDPIVTEINSYTKFYKADKDHQDFYRKNRESFYCRLVIDPKLKKLYKDYEPMLKANSET